MAFWVALTGSFRWTELLVGAGAALVGALISTAAEAMTLVRFLPHWQHLWKARGVIWQIPVGVGSVVGILFREGRGATGRIHSVRFYPGEETSRDQARRAVAETFPTMAPGSVVLGVDREAGIVVFHLLGTSSVPPTLRRLGESQ